MSTKKILTIVLAVGFFISAGILDLRFAIPTHASLPSQPLAVSVPYSGKLSDEVGQPVVDGIYAFTFTLYKDRSGGQPLWTEMQENVAVQGGSFAIFLGSVSPLSRDILESGARWLEVRVRGLGEMDFTLLTPRQQLSTIASLKPVSSTNGGGSACAHNHFGESWSGVSNLGLSLEDNASNSVAIQGIANSGTNAAGVLGISTDGKGVYGYSSNGIALYAGGSGVISSRANMVLYLSPHDMLIRSPSDNIDLYPLDNGGVEIINRSGIGETKYLTIPVPIYGKLYGARLYVKSIRVCYKAVYAYIVATSVIKNNGGEGYTFYIFDTTTRGSNTYECYPIIAPTPRVPIDNSTWVQFNVQTLAINEVDIYTVELTLTEAPQD
jgi:hypothetical protein